MHGIFLTVYCAHITITLKTTDIEGAGTKLHRDTFARWDTFARRHFSTSLTVRVGLRLGLGLRVRIRVGVRVKC